MRASWAVVLEPEDVEIGFVARDQLVIGEGADTLALLARMPVARPEFVKILPPEWYRAFLAADAMQIEVHGAAPHDAIDDVDAQEGLLAQPPQLLAILLLAFMCP